MTDNASDRELKGESFDELVRYTAGGFAGGLVLAAVLDAFGLQRNPIGQWLVRTLAGEGESILEGVFAIRRRLLGSAGSLAEAYGWGKLIGLVLPWIIDAASRAMHVDLYGIEGFYIPYFYAMTDQIGANVAGLWFLLRTEPTWSRGLGRYFRHPVMLTSLALVVAVPLGLFQARLLGFRPHSQILTAVETIAANLCWLPPLVGWLTERRTRKRSV